MSDLFCRHNRFTADCPICSKGTVLEKHSPSSSPVRKPPKTRAEKRVGSQFRGPYATAGPYERDGERVEVRLEKVPGGVRLAEWVAGALKARAPVLPADDLLGLVAQARERELLPQRDLDKLGEAATADNSGESAAWGASGGRAGDLPEELRVEAVGEGDVRVARWILRPRAEWELQDAPPMLPVTRFAEALAAARRVGAA